MQGLRAASPDNGGSWERSGAAADAAAALAPGNFKGYSGCISSIQTYFHVSDFGSWELLGSL